MRIGIICLQLRLWLKVSEAIAQDNQKAATEEKSKLEDEQRARAKSGVHHKPKWFKQDLLSKNYEYIHAELVILLFVQLFYGLRQCCFFLYHLLGSIFMVQLQLKKPKVDVSL